MTDWCINFLLIVGFSLIQSLFCSTSLLHIIGLYLFQLFADLLDIFANQYLHHVDNDNILIFQVHHVAKKANDRLGSNDLKTKRAGDFLNSLATDEFQNIRTEFWTKAGNHNITLNAKITGRGNSLVKVKEACLKMKTEILQCMIDNIND